MIRPAHILLLLLSACFAACRPSAPPPAPLKARIDSISRRVESIRGERFLKPVDGRVIKRADLLRIYDSVSMDEPDPADSAWDRMIWTLGFIDSLGALDGVADSVDQASIEAFYSKGVLWVVDEMLDSNQLDVTIAHELAHALQDQRWNLAQLYRTHRGLDQRLSLQYLLEGEARLVETLYAHPEHAPNRILELLPQLTLEAFRDTLRNSMGLDPEFVTLPTYHTYEQGARALAVRRASRGWKGVDEWFAEPPPSSCFLWPTDSCRRPIDPDPTPLFSAGKGWWLLREGRVGEHYLDILLSVWRDSNKWIPPGEIKSAAILKEHPTEPDPDRVASGWNGDRFQVWRDRDGNLGLAWRTAWKDSVSAQAFLDAYLRILVRKQRDDSIWSRGRTFALLHDAQAGVWDRVERFGSEVWITEGAPGSKPFRFLNQPSSGPRRQNSAMR